MIGYLHIHAYTFENTGVGGVSGLRIYLHGLYHLLGVGCDVKYICMGCIACLVSGVTSLAERNTAVCTNAKIIMHVCKGRDR